MIRCNQCLGRGRQRCNSCNGQGRVEERINRDGQFITEWRQCPFCHGHGRIICSRCGGLGRVQCPTCMGRANLRWYLRLTVKWQNHLTDKFVERTDMPDNLIKNAKGHALLTEDYPRVAPIAAFVVQEVVADSQATVQAHFQQYAGTGVILRQRQILRQVPVSEVKYRFKEKTFRFFVYGLDHLVFDDEYPQTCLWCRCTIL